MEYTIVGSAEADPMNGRISNESPVGMALLGHKKDDIIMIETPDGRSGIQGAEIYKIKPLQKNGQEEEKWQRKIRS